jgi:hypothetical protein
MATFLADHASDIAEASGIEPSKIRVVSWDWVTNTLSVVITGVPTEEQRTCLQDWVCESQFDHVTFHYA